MRRVYGCDVCQEVCPRNNIKKSEVFPRDEFLELIAKDFSLPELLCGSPEFYKTRVYPIMYNYINELKYFKRNAAIAMGNTGEEAYMPHLISELTNSEALVRQHVAWAIGKIGGSKAKQALENRLAYEDSPEAAQEIKMALNNI